jgi:hypothetical protein
MKTAKSLKLHDDVLGFVVFEEQKGLDKEVLAMAEIEVSNKFLNFSGCRSLSDNSKSIELFSDFVSFPGFLDFDGCANIDQMNTKKKGKGVRMFEGFKFKILKFENFEFLVNGHINFHQIMSR